MIQIKKFKENVSDKVVNDFIKQTKGEIVNFNPIIIKYKLKEDILEPTITYKGVGNKITFSAENHKYDKYMNEIDIRFNSVLFYCDKIIFLQDLKIITTLNILKNDNCVIYDKNNEIQLCVDFIDNERWDVLSLMKLLENSGIYPSENFVGYNKRTEIFEKLGDNISNSINNVANSTKKLGEELSNSIYSLSDTNKIIHNSPGRKVR